MKRLTSALIALGSLAAVLTPLAAEAGDGRHGDRHGAREGYWTRPSDARHWRRGDRYWWRGRPEWRGYAGRRAGFWYAPGYGYYAIDSRWDRGWRRGEYLPPAYRQYYVADPWFYGLRPAPRGYAWVYAGGDIVLVSRSSGLILDVLGDVY